VKQQEEGGVKLAEISPCALPRGERQTADGRVGSGQGEMFALRRRLEVLCKIG